MGIQCHDIALVRESHENDRVVRQLQRKEAQSAIAENDRDREVRRIELVTEAAAKSKNDRSRVHELEVIRLAGEAQLKMIDLEFLNWK